MLLGEVLLQFGTKTPIKTSFIKGFKDGAGAFSVLRKARPLML